MLDGLDVRHLERLVLSTSYTVVAARIVALATAARADAVVVDATGPGRAVVDMLEAAGLAPTAVTITGGRVVRVRGREVSLPRSALFLPLQAAVEAGRLRVAPPLGCPAARRSLASSWRPRGAFWG